MSRCVYHVVVWVGLFGGACGGRSDMQTVEPMITLPPSAAGTPSHARSAEPPLAAATGMQPSAATSIVQASTGSVGPSVAGASGSLANTPAAGMTGAGTNPAASPAAAGCEPRVVTPSTGIHFHHVHFNTVDPDKDLEFYEKYFGSTVTTFCSDKAQQPIAKANKTERAWFLYNRVSTPPDMKLNTYLEHIGWINQDPEGELMRLVALGAPRYPEGRAQCQSAAAGTAACFGYWFYLLAPSGARVEVALGPGPATSGYGHVHFVMGEDYAFMEKLTNGALKNQAIDDVNHTDAALVEDTLSGEMVVDTRGKPIDHLGYSTSNLDAERDRIVKAGITIAEEISYKPEFGFRSFFVETSKGTWLEMVEDSQFEQAK